MNGNGGLKSFRMERGKEARRAREKAAKQARPAKKEPPGEGPYDRLLPKLRKDNSQRAPEAWMQSPLQPR
jgi:hypothetical protein